MTPAEALETTKRLYRELGNRRPAMLREEQYYRGKQPLRFASEKWAEYNATRYEKFADNWCAPVANSPQERLRVDGFALDEDPGLSDTEKALWRDWQLNNMEMQSSQGFLGSLTSARSFVLVWGDEEGEPVATWERGDQAIVGYDVERPGRRVAALKAWCDDDREYATLYTPDQVWKWERPRVEAQKDPYGRALPPTAEAYFLDTRGLVLPLALLNNDGWRPRGGVGANPIDNPMGLVPMVEVPNRPMLGGDPLSEIGGTMAMQDAINLLWAYLFNAADFASMPARVVMGQEPPKIPILDDTGQKVGERQIDLKKLAEDRILWLTSPNAKTSQWEAAKLDVFTGTIEVAVSHIAAQTRTPPHYLILGKGMVNVNADGMKAAETGLVMKVQEEQLFFGPAVREVFRLFALVRGQKAIADQCRTGVVQWKDAENRSEAQVVDALQKLQAIGFPFRWLAERYGLSPTEIERLLDMREKEAQQSPMATIARGLADTRVTDGAPVDADA